MAQTTIPLETRPAAGAFGLEVLGLQLRRPVDEGLFATLSELLAEHALLLFRDQDLAPADLVAWSGRFGPLERHSEAFCLLEGHSEVVVVGNLVVDGQPRSIFVNVREEWHFDYAYAQEPSVGALFFAREVPPEGGDTLFADTRAAYDGLPPDLKAEADRRQVVYSYRAMDRHLRALDPTRPPLGEETFAAWPPARLPLAQSHPGTGRKTLRLAPEVMEEVEGLSRAAAEDLLARLLAHTLQPAYRYDHRWREGDLVIFDNASLIHSASAFDTDRHRRIMYRTTIMPAGYGAGA